MKTAADILENKKKRLICTSSDKTVHEALSIMHSKKVGAILLTKPGSEDITGIWTERDLMRNVMDDNFDPRTAIIGDYMTTELRSAPAEATIAELKEMILQHFIRHILIEDAGRYVGMLSVGDVIRASLIEQDQHIEELRAHTSWHYYENWGWESA